MKFSALFIAAWLATISSAHAVPTAAPVDVRTIEGHKWLIVAASTEHSDTSDIWPRHRNGAVAYLLFSHGKMSGSLGCGELAGSYHRARNRMRIAATWRDTAGACTPELRKQAQALLASLNTSERGLSWGGEMVFLADRKGGNRPRSDPIQSRRRSVGTSGHILAVAET